MPKIRVTQAQLRLANIYKLEILYNDLNYLKRTMRLSNKEIRKIVSEMLEMLDLEK